jgi:hypothetical protein
MTDAARNLDSVVAICSWIGATETRANAGIGFAATEQYLFIVSS